MHLCLSFEENPPSNEWDSSLLYLQANSRFGWWQLIGLFPTNYQGQNSEGWSGTICNGEAAVTYMTDEVREQITLSGNKLAQFSGADLPYSQDPTYIPNAVSFGLDSITSQLPGFFHTELPEVPSPCGRVRAQGRSCCLGSGTVGGGGKAKCHLVISCDLDFL